MESVSSLNLSNDINSVVPFDVMVREEERRARFSFASLDLGAHQSSNRSFQFFRMNQRDDECFPKANELVKQKELSFSTRDVK